jgi:uncharacterized SAM-binding protein YcdF (DUF218 family)
MTMNLLLGLKYLKTVLKNLVLPPSGSLLLAFAGLLLLRRSGRLGRCLIVLGTASLWLLSTPVVADWLTSLIERYPPLNLSQPTQAGAIVILGGGGQRAFAPEYGGAEADPYLLERIAYGAYIAQKTGLPILVTGFHDEATAMHDTLERHFGIEARWVDDQSYDTFENARNSVRMLHTDGIERVILLTRATHLWRASQEFTAAGMQIVPAPVGALAPREHSPFRYFPDSQALMRSHDAIYESLGEVVRQGLSITHLRRH